MMNNDKIEVGVFTKPHGIKGEITALFPNGLYEPAAGDFVFADIDGLPVPFRILGVRTKGAESFLLTIKGISDEPAAASLAGKAILVDEDLVADIEDDGEGFYLDDLIGFELQADGTTIGTIDDFDDSTDNALFIVRTPAGDTILVPASGELIEAVDTDAKIIAMDLPEGLTSLNA